MAEAKGECRGEGRKEEEGNGIRRTFVSEIEEKIDKEDNCRRGIRIAREVMIITITKTLVIIAVMKTMIVTSICRKTENEYSERNELEKKDQREW